MLIHLKQKLQELVSLINSLNINITNLKEELNKKSKSTEERAKHFSNNVKAKMEILRENVDKLEEITPKEYWPMPTYIDLLYGV